MADECSRISFLIHDGGRAAAGFKGNAGDCAVRAAALAIHGPGVNGPQYRAIYDELFALQREYHASSRRRAVKRAASRSVGASPRGGVWTEVLGPFLNRHGAEWHALSGIGKPPVRISECAARWPDRTVVLRVHRHLSTMINGRIYDTWGQHPEKMVYGAWLMPEKCAGNNKLETEAS